MKNQLVEAMRIQQFNTYDLISHKEILTSFSQTYPKLHSIFYEKGLSINSYAQSINSKLNIVKNELIINNNIMFTSNLKPPVSLFDFFKVQDQLITNYQIKTKITNSLINLYDLDEHINKYLVEHSNSFLVYDLSNLNSNLIQNKNVSLATEYVMNNYPKYEKNFQIIVDNLFLTPEIFEYFENLNELILYIPA